MTNQNGSVDFEHHRIVRDGVGLHAVTCGTGPAVLLIHGFPQHWWMWRHLMIRLASEGYRAVAIDQRGMGGSDIPPDGYDKQTLAGDATAVLERLGIDRAAVVGYDHGGGTALALAYTRPDLIDRLAVVEYVPPGFGYEFGLVAAPGNVNWQLAFFTHPDVAITFIAGKERELLSWYFWHWAHNPDAIPSGDFEVYVRQLQKPGALRGGFAQFASVFRDQELFAAWAARGPLPMPVLGIGGEIAAGPYIESALARLASDATAKALPHCGHWVVEEQPDLFAGELLSFLGRSVTR